MHGRMGSIALSVAAGGLLLLAPSPGSTADGAGTAGASAVGTTVPSPVCLARKGPVASGSATFVRQVTVAGTGGRVLDVTLDSPAMGGEQHIDVLLPRHYDPSGATRYPVLYLLHGAGGSYEDWVSNGVEADIDYTSVGRDLPPFITVMPDGGAWGFYSDWYGTDPETHTHGPPPAYATYDIDELIPWIDAHFPTKATQAGRAIAGLSMGGFGAMSLAARNPDLFTAAGSFSGAVDTDIEYPVGGEALSLLSSAFTRGPPAQCVWGDALTQGVRWHGADPTYLAPNLSTMSLFVASGNGKPGLYDPPGNAGNLEDGLVETFIFGMNEDFAAALNAAHIDYTPYFYGNGTHSWGYWLRDLAHFLPQMSFAFATSGGPHTAPFTYRTVDEQFSEYGYSFSIAHTAEEFTYLDDVSATGLTVTGTGPLSVVTPGQYTPGRSYLIAVARSGSGTTLRRQLADSAGRLSFAVDLGKPNPVQQVNFSTIPSSFAHAVVTITPN